MLGPPDTVVELGETEVSEEIFMEYLSSLGESTYRLTHLHLVASSCFGSGHQTLMAIKNKHYQLLQGKDPCSNL